MSLLICPIRVVVVRLPIPIEGKGVTPIFNSLQNWWNQRPCVTVDGYNMTGARKALVGQIRAQLENSQL